MAILLFLGLGFAQGSSPALGSVRGDVFTKGTNGEPAVLPSVRIVLHGPITKETESDALGAFAIDGLPPGTYQIEANAPGLSGGLSRRGYRGHVLDCSSRNERDNGQQHGKRDRNRRFCS